MLRTLFIQSDDQIDGTLPMQAYCRMRNKITKNQLTADYTLTHFYKAGLSDVEDTDMNSLYEHAKTQ